jgi:hypothetical protein
VVAQRSGAAEGASHYEWVTEAVART